MDTFVTPGLVGIGVASAQDCQGAITVDQAMKAETARYAAQMTNDFAQWRSCSVVRDRRQGQVHRRLALGPDEVPQDDPRCTR